MSEEKKLPGTPLKSKDIEEGKVITIEDKVNAKYAWSAGVAMSKFLEELKKGKIIGRKCSKCGTIYVPPRMFCIKCFAPTDEWVYVKDTGTVNTAVVSYIGADRGRLGEPKIIAVIELDGASPGMGFLHLLKGVSPEDVKNMKVFGMKVKAVWKPENEREGSITDIMYFEPVEG